MYVPSYLFVKQETLIYNEQMKAWQKLFPFVFLNRRGTEKTEVHRAFPCYPCLFGFILIWP